MAEEVLMLTRDSTLEDTLSNLGRNLRRVQEVIKKQMADGVENYLGFSGGMNSDEAKITQTRYMAETINHLSFGSKLRTKLAEIEACCDQVLAKHRREDLETLERLLKELMGSLLALQAKAA